MGDNQKIEQANMDGSDRKIFVDTDVPMATVVMVDPETDLVYWCDIYKATVEMMFINKTGRRVLFKADYYQFHHVFGMTILNSRIYFSDLSRTQISSCDKLNGSLSSCQQALITGKDINAIKAFGRKFQPYCEFIINLNLHAKVCPFSLAVYTGQFEINYDGRLF